LAGFITKNCNCIGSDSNFGSVAAATVLDSLSAGEPVMVLVVLPIVEIVASGTILALSFLAALKVVIVNLRTFLVQSIIIMPFIIFELYLVILLKMETDPAFIMFKEPVEL
jgi:hypothetical protein